MAADTQRRSFFPNFYGMNWNAFMDAVTGLVSMPRRIDVLGWSHLRHVLPEDARYFESCIQHLREECVFVEHSGDFLPIMDLDSFR
ncbi:MAG: barstar family protein [Thermoguttaceae bacterium]|nr:barstar family protein [Thermoguttaceae bacterium]